MFVCGTRPRPRTGFLLAGWGRTVRQQAERTVFGASGGYAGRTSGSVPAWVSGECGGAVGSGGRGGCGKRGSRSGATRAADIVADCGAARSKKRLPIGRKGRRISGRRVVCGTVGPQPEPSSAGGGGRPGRGVGSAVRVTAGRSGPGLQFGPQCQPFPRRRCRSGQCRSAQHCRLRPVPQYRCRPG